MSVSYSYSLFGSWAPDFRPREPAARSTEICEFGAFLELQRSTRLTRVLGSAPVLAVARCRQCRECLLRRTTVAHGTPAKPSLTGCRPIAPRRRSTLPSGCGRVGRATLEWWRCIDSGIRQARRRLCPASAVTPPLAGRFVAGLRWHSTADRRLACAGSMARASHSGWFDGPAMISALQRIAERWPSG